MIDYILAVLLPPVATIKLGRIWATIATLIFAFTFVCWPIASLIAVVVVRDDHRKAAAVEAAIEAARSQAVLPEYADGQVA